MHLKASQNKLKDNPICPLNTRRDRVVSIEFPQDAARARKVISRSNAHISGKWPSFKNGRAMHYESANERNAFKLLDASPEVISYLEQPCVIKYVIDGVDHLHFPDILVIYPTHRELWEVKTEEDAKNSDVAKRTALIAKELPFLGFQYKMVMAEDLKKNPRLNNVTHLLRYGRACVTMQEREQIRQIFKKNHFQAWGNFQFGSAGAIHRKAICRLILEGFVTVNLNLPLESSTVLTYIDRDPEIKLWQ